MVNIGPAELMILAIVAVIVLGPDRIPGLARDAAKMIKTLRDLATGAQKQLRDELGPEFADLDLRTLNPRTALQRAILGDEENGIRADLRKLDPREDLRDSLRGIDPRDDVRSGMRAMDPRTYLDEDDDDSAAGSIAASGPSFVKRTDPAGTGTPDTGERAAYDYDAT